MVTYKIHLIRTGSTSDGMWKRYVGQSDVPLCQQGIENLEALKEDYQYPLVEQIYSSPLSRCTETAAIIYPDKNVVLVDDLMDMHLGEFEGKSFDELRNSAAFNNWIKNSFEHTPPGGEQTVDFTERIIHAISDIFAEMMQDQLRSVAVVTHGGVIMTLLAAIGLPKLPIHQWSVQNGSGYTIQMTPQMWMRDRAAEVFSHVPTPKVEDEMDVYDLYYNK